MGSWKELKTFNISSSSNSAAANETRMKQMLWNNIKNKLIRLLCNTVFLCLNNISGIIKMIYIVKQWFLVHILTHLNYHHLSLEYKMSYGLLLQNYSSATSTGQSRTLYSSVWLVAVLACFPQYSG